MTKKDWARVLLIGLGMGLGPAIINHLGWWAYAGFVLVYTGLFWLVDKKMKS